MGMSENKLGASRGIELLPAISGAIALYAVPFFIVI
jgi:hypothetical protein